jgi:GTP-binding protein HflX
LTRAVIDRQAPPQRALVIQPAQRHSHDLRGPQARLDEAVGLALALDLEIVEAVTSPLSVVAAATLFGRGKVDEIAEKCRALAIDVVVVDHALTPVQQRNLERAWDAKTLDRTGLILEIFARRARTKEGRLQVELARLTYERSRLVRTWTHLERQRGGFGFMGGPGETQIEADKRLLLDRISKIKLEIDDVRRTRNLQRRARSRAPTPSIALVGYTNAGKSTLFNRLTQADVLAKSMLFATLDPTLRRLRLPAGRSAVISDTVGFISDLPHELVEAFRATLDEVREADVIVHVRDVSAGDSDAQSRDVEEVLSGLGAGPGSGRVVIEVWNKIDLLEPEHGLEIKARAAALGHVAVSAASGEGMDELRQTLTAVIDDGPEQIFELKLVDTEALAWLYRHGRVVSRRENCDCAIVSAKLDAQALGQFERMRPKALLRTEAC